MAGPPLGEDFFDRPPREVAVELIGCTLLHGGVGGRIVEVEAYEQDDPACHAFGGRTPRNAPLFGPPGIAYVYLCYGIHSMFNVVADGDGIAAAVLVRALEPTHGLETMRERRAGKSGRAGPGDRIRNDRYLCSGPGKVCEALAIELPQTGTSAVEEPFRLHSPPDGASPPDVAAGPRIGLTKARERPWRYFEADNDYLSRR